MIFDSHIHLWKKNVATGNTPDNQWAKYRRLAIKKNIFKALALPYPAPSPISKIFNNYIMQSYQKNKDLLIPFQLISDDLNPTEILNNDIAGFKEHFMLGKYNDMKTYNAAYDFLQQNGLFLLIHPHMTERVEKIKYLKSNFPSLKIILAHSGRKWPFTGDDVMESVIPALKDFDSLYFDTSTIRDGAVIAQMVNSLGSQRILFGSDYPYFDKEGEDVYDLELEAVRQAPISDSDKEDIFTGNFKRLFLDDAWVRRCSIGDKDELLALITTVPPKEKKYLALEQKMSVIRSEIKNQRHLYVIETESNICGFLRESGRSQNGAVIEEIYIPGEYRGKGYAARLLDTVLHSFQYLEAKTYRENVPIAALLKKFDFQVDKTSTNGNIIYWKRINDSD